MPDKGFAVAQLDDIPPVAENDLLPADWKPVRHHLGIEAFGMNAYVATEDGQRVVEEHDEGDNGHQEVYFVVSGHADFEVGGERIDAPAGTFVFLADPDLRRGAIARTGGTTVLAVGGWPDRPFQRSDWEKRYLGD